MSRADNAAAVKALRGEGVTVAEISERLNLSRSYVYGLTYDPDGSKDRARKDSYRQPCPQCGKSMDGSNGRSTAPVLCRECRTWTPEACIEAIQDWAAANGGIPPRRDDTIGADDLPAGSTVERLFGRWNDGLQAAGFALHVDRRPETWDGILNAVRRGEATADIAERYGVSPSAIHQRFSVRGLRLADFRPGRRAAA